MADPLSVFVVVFVAEVFLPPVVSPRRLPSKSKPPETFLGADVPGGDSSCVCLTGRLCGVIICGDLNGVMVGKCGDASGVFVVVCGDLSGVFVATCGDASGVICGDFEGHLCFIVTSRSGSTRVGSSSTQSTFSCKSKSIIGLLWAPFQS